MRKIMLSGCLVAALCFASGCGNNQNHDAVESAEESNEHKAEAKEEAAEAQGKDVSESEIKDDAEFAVKAANGGMMEVELAKLADAKATSKEVKTFAHHMTTDHSKANEELKTLAAQKNITLPVALSEESQKDLDRLSKLSGHEFDEEYIKFMVDDHQEDVDMFKKAAEDCKDGDLKAFASKTLPTLENHLQMAKQTKETVDKMDKQSSMK